MKRILFHAAAALALSGSAAFSQAIDIHAASKPVEEQQIQVAEALPVPTLTTAPLGQVSLQSGVFQDRRELAKAYLERLKTDNLLQNHYLEAGMTVNTPGDQMHQGWEAPSCQLRGHFVGHWLSAAAHFAATDDDKFLADRADEVVKKLELCQTLNKDGWVGSIPEKFFAILEQDRWIWSPQYTLHKTMMGLYDDYAYLGDKEALAVDERSAEWFLKWTDELIKKGRSDVIYGGESAGMLELWAELYGATHDARFLTLASRYAMPDMFRQLLDGQDALTGNHTNASIPWVQGAARLYEVTGDTKYREIVEKFWNEAVVTRGMFATTGNNAGEFWIPPQQFGSYLASRTQEHCTVYNMMRVAQYLFRWTGEAQYADYIERALYNGILAQQNPGTGMVAYFLPLEPGAKKTWGSETHDFWCCDGTMVQAQAMYEDLIYYIGSDGVTVSQYIPSKAELATKGGKVRISQSIDSAALAAEMAAPSELTHLTQSLSVDGDSDAPWTLRLRQPAWALDTATVTIDGKPLKVSVDAKGFIEITRVWKNAKLSVSFPKRLTREALPGDPARFALLDGPIVLAALTSVEPELTGDAKITPQLEHLYESGRVWRTSHYLAQTTRGTVALKPLYEVADDAYCVYFHKAQ